MEVLRIGIDGDKLNSVDPGLDHPLEGVPSGTAATDDFYPGKCFKWWFDLSHKSLGLKLTYMLIITNE